MKIISLGLLCTALLFNGCGSDDENKTDVKNEIISNIGNNLNGLGYYGAGVKFGNHDIVGRFKHYQISEDGDVLNNYSFVPMEYTLDGISKMSINNNNSYVDVGIYGVNDDGNILYDYSYIGQIDIPGEKQSCLKIHTIYNGNDVFDARCYLE